MVQFLNDGAEAAAGLVKVAEAGLECFGFVRFVALEGGIVPDVPVI